MIWIFPFFLFHRLSFYIIFDSPFPVFSISLPAASSLTAFFQRSPPLLGRFISMFSSPPLPPPLFHPKHISQPRLSASLTSYPSPPPPPPVLTSPLLFRRCRPPWSLRSLSSPFHLFQIPLLHCLPMPLLHSSVCASVCVWSQVNTHPYWLLTFYPQWQHWLVRSRGKKWKPSRRRRCIPLSCCVSYHCWTHGCAQMPERTAARRSRPRAHKTHNTHKHTITSLKTTKPSARNKSSTFQWEAEFAASQNRSLTILNMAWLQ